MLFLLLHCATQNLKDAIMVTTAGAETLPWLASCVVLPASITFFMLYKRIVETLPQQMVFYAVRETGTQCVRDPWP